MIICLDGTRMCKICILSGQIKTNKDRMDELKMDIDLITGKLNETNLYADDTKSIRKEMELIEEEVVNIEKDQLDFSGFTKPDFTKVDKVRKEETDTGRRSWDDETNEDDGREMLKEDVGKMVTMDQAGEMKQ